MVLINNILNFIQKKNGGIENDNILRLPSGKTR